jgi:CBS domain-containing protein
MTTTVEHVHVDDTLQHAAVRMSTADVGGLPVLDGDRLVGMLTDRDLALRAVAAGLNPKRAAVRDVYSPQVVHCLCSHSLDEAAAIMQGSGLRRLPVLNEGGTLVGMLSVSDLSRRADHVKKAGEIVGRTSADGPRARDRGYDSAPKLK